MSELLPLKIAIADYGHTRALKSGEVPIKGVDPNFVQVVPIIGAFRRMVRDVEFDVCEMAPTTYMIARALGAPFVALPIFIMRRGISPCCTAYVISASIVGMLAVSPSGRGSSPTILASAM